jgi:hypothetical protein
VPVRGPIPLDWKCDALRYCVCGPIPLDWKCDALHAKHVRGFNWVLGVFLGSGSLGSGGLTLCAFYFTSSVLPKCLFFLFYSLLTIILITDTGDLFCF